MNIHDIQLPSNRKFGVFFTIVFLIVGAYLLYNASITASYTCFGVAVTFLTVSFTAPKLLFPLNLLWMRLGLLMGRIVNQLYLGDLFFGLTPFSLVLNLTGRDELKIKTKHKQTYWIKRLDSKPSGETFKNQF